MALWALRCRPTRDATPTRRNATLQLNHRELHKLQYSDTMIRYYRKTRVTLSPAPSPSHLHLQAPNFARRVGNHYLFYFSRSQRTTSPPPTPHPHPPPLTQLLYFQSTFPLFESPYCLLHFESYFRLVTIIVLTAAKYTYPSEAQALRGFHKRNFFQI